MENKEVLPIGTVVQLKGEKAVRVMIVGYLCGDGNSVYDYAAVRYPAGEAADDIHVLFNEPAIERVLFEGFTGKDGEGLRIAQEAVAEARRRMQEKPAEDEPAVTELT